MDYRALAFWFGVGQWLVTIGTIIYVWVTNRQKATQQEIHDLDSRLDTHEDRLIRSEERIKQLPSAREAGTLSIHIERLDGHIRELRQEIGGVRNGLKPFTEAVTRIEDYLLKGGGQ